MNTSKIILETKNLTLEPISMKYAKEIFKEFTPEITLYMLPKSPETLDDVVNFIESSSKENELGSNFQIVILNKETGEYLGNARLQHIDTKTPELEVWIKKSAQGNSYGKETVIALKKWADENLNYDYILYPVIDLNYASRRIPEFLNGTIFREYDQEIKGNMQHMLEYRIYPIQ